MRKVLLATTALVALNVSAASADVSISGTGTFDIVEDSGNTTFASDGNIVIKGTTTTDSGLTLTAAHDMKFEGQNDASTSINAQIADSYIDIAGDFGSIRMGNTDDALDRMDGVLPANMDIEGVSASGVGTAIGDDSVNVSFMSPSFNGITVYASTTADAGSVGYGANYKNGPIHVMYQAQDDGTNDATAVGASFSAGPVTVAAGASNSKAGSTTTKSSDVGASYTMGDIKFVATSQKRGTSKYSNFGASYSVAPGLTVSAESGGMSGGDNGTFLSVAVSF
jgi:outer membrane protein OmpU